MPKTTRAEVEREITHGQRPPPWRYGEPIRKAPVLGAGGPVGSALAWALAVTSYSCRFMMMDRPTAEKASSRYRSLPGAPIVVYGPSPSRPAAVLVQNGPRAGHWVIIMHPPAAKLLTWAKHKALRRLQRQTGLRRTDCDALIRRGFRKAVEASRSRA